LANCSLQPSLGAPVRFSIEIGSKQRFVAKRISAELEVLKVFHLCLPQSKEDAVSFR